MRRARGCGSVFPNSFIHKVLLEFLQLFWRIMQRVSPYSIGVLIFMCFLDSVGSVDRSPFPVLDCSNTHFVLLLDAMEDPVMTMLEV